MDKEAMHKKLAKQMQERIDRDFHDCVLQRGAFAPIEPEFGVKMRALGLKWCPFARDWVRF